MLSYGFVEPYEIIEHTADAGIRAFGGSPEELFTHMAEGFFSLIVDPEGVRAMDTRTVEAAAQGWEGLMRAWLKELLVLFDTDHFIAKTIRIERLEPVRIRAVLSGERLDSRRHALGKEVKAVTCHEFSVERAASGAWTAQVIFDI